MSKLTETMTKVFFVTRPARAVMIGGKQHIEACHEVYADRFAIYRHDGKDAPSMHVLDLRIDDHGDNTRDMAHGLVAMLNNHAELRALIYAGNEPLEARAEDVFFK